MTPPANQEARLKIASRLLAIVAFGALSASAALAQEAPVGSKGGLQPNAAGTLVEPPNPGPDTNPIPGETKPVLPGNAPVSKLSADATSKSAQGLNGAALNILRMGGPGSRSGPTGSGALGGPSAINSGALSGNMFHPKHP